ncbi:asparagine synthase C-terminal domain-containing protein [Halalkalicoccus jeotgali]|uniref:Asparagine synthase n=1 Tax=Halalkalicoccus jeotgali (strain DSM 18796 / CECT 7217 / JCM 14584 / KCTC 4019 / B3) TaxID=795797 RepID=D8J2S9_HALJB|nr:asparagine synthase-related protein [Halalkalicoccus jeotgali]ADJ15036.1 asparagine synthase [Halalkalicoccus jeotgali B3]ELY34946.1 asparagine synthase [Halalkalicoccus jeotgali B3]
MIHGSDSALVERALEDRDPFPGTRGFAGDLPDGRLVRDVLGRVPLFVERTGEGWGFSPTALADPVPFPAGHVDDERVWTLPAPSPFAGEREAVAATEGAIGASLALDSDGLAVAFSGGVDSAVVASRLEAPLYVVGFEGSHDIAAAREGASAMGRDLRVVECTHADIERAVPRVARATDRTNAMDVGIALSLFLVAERAVADGFDRLAIGQGADELFGGYEKVVRTDHRVESDSVRGATREVIASLPDQLERDVLAIRAAGAEPVAPLLDDRVVRAALRLDGPMLATDEERKRVFREAAREFVPREVANREKKAMQYGSLIARELDRLARQAGFKRRMDDHVTKYVESLLD